MVNIKTDDQGLGSKVVGLPITSSSQHLLISKHPGSTSVISYSLTTHSRIRPSAGSRGHSPGSQLESQSSCRQNNIWIGHLPQLGTTNCALKWFVSFFFLTLLNKGKAFIQRSQDWFRIDIKSVQHLKSRDCFKVYYNLIL